MLEILLGAYSHASYAELKWIFIKPELRGYVGSLIIVKGKYRD